jgi:hypothetical protein
MGIKKVHILFVLVGITLSCSNTLDEKSYMIYLSNIENGLHIRQKINSFIYSSQYVTEDWYKIKAKKTDNQFFEREREDFLANDEIHLIFMISSEDNTNPIQKEMKNEKEYSERLVQMNKNLERLFTIEQEGEVIECAFALSEANYLMMSKINITLAFEGVDKEKDFTLRFNDRIWRNGPIKFKYEKKDIKNINRIKAKI